MSLGEKLGLGSWLKYQNGFERGERGEVLGSEGFENVFLEDCWGKKSFSAKLGAHNLPFVFRLIA
jgi:hypothetical protein